MHSCQLVNVIGRLLMKQAITSLEAMLAQTSLEILDPRFICPGVGRRWQEFEPNGIEAEAAQTQHPLQRHRKNTAAFGIFCRKPATKKDRHWQRIVRLGLHSSQASAGFNCAE